MKFFKRRQKAVSVSAVPQEIQAYTQAEHREKIGVAALVGFISLLLTLIVLFGLFIGGRWLYRKIAGPSQKASNTTVVEKNDTASQKDKATTDSNTNNNSSENDTNGINPAQQSENTVSAPQTSSAPQSTTPSTGATLPQTGPDQDL